MNAKEVRKRLRIPVFHGWLYLYQNVAFDEIAEKHSIAFDEKGFDAASGSGMDNDEVSYYIIAIMGDVGAGSIAHEALHTVNYIMKDRDMTPDLDNDEWQCYLIGWIVTQCHRYMTIG